MKRFAISAVFVLVALAAIVPSEASAAPAKAKVTIDYYTPLLLGGWQGTVKSERKACMKERKVILYKREGDDNSKVGSAKTQKDRGGWIWFITADEENGKYFAFAPPTSRCEGAESKLFRYPQDNPDPSSTSARAAKASAKVTVKGWHSTILTSGLWSGVVKSDKKKCQKDRYVELFLRQGKENQGIGNANTVKEGNKWIWVVQTSGGEPDEGKYFALAAPTDDCKRAESKIFTYPDDNPARRRPPPAAATEAKVKISRWEGPPIQVGGPGTWYGTVKSDKNSCRLDRKVTLIYKDPAGSNLKIGTDRTEKDGDKYGWEINQAKPSEGPYVAKVGKDPGCAKAKSKPFDYPEDNEPF